MRFLNGWRPKYGLLALGAIVVALVASAWTPAESEVPPSSLEVVQGSYLHLNMNITDLRTRVASWQKGDEGSLGVAREKLERIERVLSSTGWPKEMARSIARTRAAIGPLDGALKAEDKTAAETASAELGEASHDIIHEFYGDFLPGREGTTSGSMSAHVVYLDLAGNIADLQSRIANWQKGDEGSMGIAEEKAERIEVLIPHLYSTGVVVKDLPPIQRALPAVFAAIERKDAAAAAQAVKPIAGAAQVLSRDFYTWMELERAGSDPACVQASYLDITRSISDLRGAVTTWGKGEAAGLAAATDSLARVELLLTHTAWPGEMAEGIDRTAGALGLMSKALLDENLGAAEAASAALGEGSHDITHDFYDLWLPTGGLQGIKASGQGRAQTAGSGAHGHGKEPAAQAVSEGLNWIVIGGFVAIMALVVFGAAFTRPRSVVPQAGALPDGSEA